MDKLQDILEQAMEFAFAELLCELRGQKFMAIGHHDTSEMFFKEAEKLSKRL